MVGGGDDRSRRCSQKWSSVFGMDFFDGGNRSEQFHHIIKIIGRWYGRIANVMASSWMGAENRSIEEAARMVKI